LSISNILTKAGYAVEKANCAAEGLTKFKSGSEGGSADHRPQHAGMNGIEFIKEVRTLPNYKFMPILFLTTESQQSKRTRSQGRRRLGLAGEARHRRRTARHHQAGRALDHGHQDASAPTGARSFLIIVDLSRIRGLSVSTNDWVSEFRSRAWNTRATCARLEPWAVS
jgi:CheY-like chemotaxis protein